MSEMPWLTTGANDWLEKNLKPNFDVFEFGSGNSTQYFSRKVRTVISVEHNPEYNRSYHSNVTLIMVELKDQPIETKYHYNNYVTTDETYKAKSFEEYVKTIDRWNNKSFDLVLVDGRSRASCIKHSIDKIKTGGYFILDDAEREEYQEAQRVFLNSFISESFVENSKVTTIWIIK